MFYGRYPHKLNAKNQVTLPSRLREALERSGEGPGLFILQVDGRCLYLYTQTGLDQVVEILKKAGGAGTKRADGRRMFFSSIHPVELDPHGRFVIPAELREDVAIQKNVIFVGNADRIELWDASRWDELESTEQEAYRQRLQQNVTDLLEW